MEENVYVTDPAFRPSPASMRRVSWGAIIAGLFVTIVTQVTLTLLGAAIGAATVDPLHEARPAEGLMTAAGIWFIASALLSLFAGAYVAGRLAGGPRRADGLLHGIVMWSVAEVVMLLLLMTSIGALIGGSANVMGTVIQSQRAQGHDPFASLRQDLNQAREQAEQKLSPTGQPTGTPGVPQVNEQQAREIGQKAASGVSTGALVGFIGMVLGLAIAAWGGWAGTASLPRYRETVVTAPAV